MAQKDILVNLNLHKQEIKDFLFENVDISTMSGSTTIEKLGNYYSPISNGGMIVQIVENNVSSFYRCNGVTWEKLQDIADIKALADERVQADITNGDGIKTETTTEGKVKVSVNNGDGLAFDTTNGKVGQLKVNNGDGLTFDTTEGKVGQLKVNTGVGTKIDTDGKVATNFAEGNGITITNDTNTTKQTFAVKVNSDTEENNIIKVDANGVASFLKIEKSTETPSDPNVKEEWNLLGNGTKIGSIPVYKDSSILSIKMVKSGATYTIKDGWTDGTGKLVLGYAYLDANGAVQVAEVDISQLILDGEIGDGLEVVDNVVKIKLDTTTESFLTLSSDGLKLSGVQKAIDTAKANAVTESKEYTDTKTTTHTHNGTDSQRISYFDLTNQPSFNEARQYQTEVLTGSSGTIKAQIHQCGTKPIAVCKTDGDETWVSFNYATNGDITWSVTKAFTQTDNAVIVVTGCSNDSSSRHDLENMWFGYEIDETESNPRLAVTRIAGSEAYKKAVFGTNGLLDGNLFRYVSKSATDGSEIDITEDIKDYTKYSKYKYGGLNGEDGDRDIFAVPKSQLFFKVETEGDTIGSRILRKKISLYQLEGFQPYHVNHNVYIGLYEATNEIKDLSGNTVNYLCSKAMLDDDTAKARYYGGSNNATINKGMARTNLSISSFSNVAHNKNTSAITDGIYEEMDYMTYLMLYDLFICDFGTLHTQDGVNTARDAEGFRQGGLGNGITDISNWSAYNGYNPIWLAGASTSVESNYKGSGCGEVLMTNPSGITGSNYMPVFYGIENIFGHIWQMVVGLHIIGENSAVSAKSYICNDPTIFSNATYRDNATIAQQESIGYKYEGTTPSSGNYMKTAQFGAMGSLLPYAVGGSSDSYFCDYHYTAAVNGLRWCLFGGRSSVGAEGGFASLSASGGWTASSTSVGSRLCFFKEVSNEQ